MKSVKELKSIAESEDVTLLLFKAGYSDKQLSRIQNYVNKHGVKMQVITSSDDVVSYINNKSLSHNEAGRKSDPITRINIFAHGLVGELAFGYGQDKTTEDKYRFDKDDVLKLDKNAFSSKAQIFSYACRTGAGKDVGFSGSETNPEKSLAQIFVNHLGVTMYALQNRSYYTGILPYQNMEAKIAEKIGLIDEDKTYDQNAGSWDTDDAINKVSYPQQSYTPIGSPSWTKFKKDKKPKVL